jgi:GTP-binding protein LepA
MKLENIRNFSIIAHIDHGKSTLADRMLEITHTIETRKMRDQVLDSMDLERERGITIKMQPVRMEYKHNGEQYVLNLIDTPGHIDFSYEVSRALKAVEGSILLIDSTQGVQAQTLTTLAMARALGLKIIPVLSKIDSPLSRVDEVKEEVVELLNCSPDEVMLVSGRTGEGVENLLQEVIKRIPEPKNTSPQPLSQGEGQTLRALVFDFKYSNHRGVIVFVRVFDGRVAKGDSLLFAVSGEKFTALEVGTFSPEETPKDYLEQGETGYIVTGIKKPGIASVGDTITMFKNPLPAFSGYMQPMPVVWASVFPENADDFAELKLALGKLKLSDSAFSYEEESSGSLGRGFRCGFLGMLHLEIITERLKREFNLELVITTPSITYEVLLKNPSTGSGQAGKRIKVYSPYFFPDDGLIEKIFEPWVKLKIITPVEYVGNIMQLLFDHEGEVGDTENFGDNRSTISVLMPLRELMRNFFDELKSTSSGYGSISYEMGEMREANVTRLDLLVADEVVPAFSRVISKKRAEVEAENAVEKLDSLLPRQMFTMKIQGRALGRIISSRTKSGMKKDVTQHMYGGDITRKMKLREKQKKGKKKMKERGRVNIPQDVFLKMMRSGDK